MMRRLESVQSFHAFHEELAGTAFVRTRIYREKQFAVFAPPPEHFDADEIGYFTDVTEHMVALEGLTARSILFKDACKYYGGRAVEAVALGAINAFPVANVKLCSNICQVAASIGARYSENSISTLVAAASDKYCELLDYLEQKQLVFGDLQYYLTFDKERIPSVGVCLRVGGSPYGFSEAVHGFVILESILAA